MQTRLTQNNCYTWQYFNHIEYTCVDTTEYIRAVSDVLFYRYIAIIQLITDLGLYRV